MVGLITVAVAATAFVGSYFVLSHPLRRPIVAAVGEPAFLGLYSVAAFVMPGGVAWAYRAAPITAPLWSVGDGPWASRR